MEGILWLAIIGAAILQITMIVTFFSMNTKLGNMETYLYQMAQKQGALEGKKYQQPTSTNRGQYNWRCPNCEVMNGPAHDKCAKCGTPRP